MPPSLRRTTGPSVADPLVSVGAALVVSMDAVPAVGVAFAVPNRLAPITPPIHQPTRSEDSSMTFPIRRLRRPVDPTLRRGLWQARRCTVRGL